VYPIPSDFVRRQLDVLFDDIEIDAVKIGMLGDASVVRAVADVLKRRRPRHVVLDPVMRASAGGALLDAAGVDALRSELLPLVTVVTPNAAEAGMLLRRPAASTENDALLAARDLCDAGAQAALVTGGHLHTGDECLDVLHERAGRSPRVFRTARVSGTGTHGTGCALSSAIAAMLSLGVPLAESCERAQRFVAEAIGAANALEVGRGVGPLHVLHRLWRCDDG
jgi:hydroxymethylpyrimidine/phosphomethylpyrimidine kinase